jgi:hypothetical protein
MMTGTVTCIARPSLWMAAEGHGHDVVVVVDTAALAAGARCTPGEEK